MRIALISDIHSNLAALQTALNKIEELQVDRILCLGDVVGYGPRPNECVELIKEKCQVSLMGNHDHAVLGLTDPFYFNQYAKDAVDWTRRVLSISNRQYLSQMPFKHVENELLFVHSTPSQPEEWHYVLSEYEARLYMEKMKQRICFNGHSHVPVVFTDSGKRLYEEEIELEPEKEKYIINVGSVGQPRDGDPRLCFVVYETDSHLLKYFRLEYPVEQTCGEILDNHLPAFLAARLKVGH